MKLYIQVITKYKFCTSTQPRLRRRERRTFANGRLRSNRGSNAIAPDAALRRKRFGTQSLSLTQPSCASQLSRNCVFRQLLSRKRAWASAFQPLLGRKRFLDELNTVRALYTKVSQARVFGLLLENVVFMPRLCVTIAVATQCCNRSVHRNCFRDASILCNRAVHRNCFRDASILCNRAVHLNRFTDAMNLQRPSSER